MWRKAISILLGGLSSETLRQRFGMDAGSCGKRLLVYSKYINLLASSAKDCSYYITSLAVLAAFVSDQLVQAWEADACMPRKQGKHGEV